MDFLKKITQKVQVLQIYRRLPLMLNDSLSIITYITKNLFYALFKSDENLILRLGSCIIEM